MAAVPFRLRRFAAGAIALAASLLVPAGERPGVLAQDTGRPDFSGFWAIDADRSNEANPGRRFSAALRQFVQQDARSLRVTTDLERAPRITIYWFGDGQPEPAVLPGQTLRLCYWQGRRLLSPGDGRPRQVRYLEGATMVVANLGEHGVEESRVFWRRLGERPPDRPRLDGDWQMEPTQSPAASDLPARLSIQDADDRVVVASVGAGDVTYEYGVRMPRVGHLVLTEWRNGQLRVREGSRQQITSWTFELRDGNRLSIRRTAAVIVNGRASSSTSEAVYRRRQR